MGQVKKFQVVSLEPSDVVMLFHSHVSRLAEPTVN
jgi:hypothetical protein